MKGGLADGKTFAQVAEHHNISVEELQLQFNKGIVVEKEHTSDVEIATEIVKDHLWEDKDYYTKLEKMERLTPEEQDKADARKMIEHAREFYSFDNLMAKLNKEVEVFAKDKEVDFRIFPTDEKYKKLKNLYNQVMNKYLTIE